MEKALRHELIKSIPELNNAIYPTNAPEGVKKPYLVYMRISTQEIKTLDGFTDKQALTYMFNVMAGKYEDMKRIRDEVEKMLMAFPKTSIGKDSALFVEDVDINNIDEQYEHELKVNRGIIDFTIYF